MLSSRKIDLLLDVGANEGQYAHRMRAIGYQGTITSFEPNPVAANVLERYAARDKRWDVRQIALGKENSVTDLNVSKNSVSSSLLGMETVHRTVAPESVYVDRQRVLVRRLDDELDAVGRRIWLKIDVQGTEHDVLSGAEKTLRFVEVIEIEMSTVSLYVGQMLMPDMLMLLHDLGFRLARLDAVLQDTVSGDLLQADGTFVRSGA